MYTLGSKLNGTTVLSLQTGQPVAKVTGQIIEPDDLELMAFYLSGKKSGETIILLRDIRRLTNDTAVIDSEDDIEEPREIVRLQALIERKFKLPGLSVYAESGQKLGKVDDYVVSLSTHKIQKLYVRPSLLRQIMKSNLIIDRTQIIDVTPEKITVRDASIPEPAVVPGAKAVPSD